MLQVRLGNDGVWNWLAVGLPECLDGMGDVIVGLPKRISDRWCDGFAVAWGGPVQYMGMGLAGVVESTRANIIWKTRGFSGQITVQ